MKLQNAIKFMNTYIMLRCFLAMAIIFMKNRMTKKSRENYHDMKRNIKNINT